ncbi:MAG TPA: hypothetical protein VHX60_15695 [Acidobacteriaceae bacterium]|jgi:tetratricopeptide (TPR) repeat protein|nr:hypothetical protein [Acidobacteriaceae bacterium]
MLAVVTYCYDWNWDKAEEQFRRALDLGAGVGTHENYGWSLATQGRFAEAHEQLRLAAEQDPLSVAPPFDESFVYSFDRNVAGERKMLAEIAHIQPDFIGVRAMDAVLSVQEKDCPSARREADWLGKTYTKLPVTQAILAYAAACEGNKGETLRRVREMVALWAPAYQVALAYAMIHDQDDAIAELEKSADAHEEQILYIKYDPFFDEIRGDPQYVALEKRVGVL